jgi:hypothetical protein
MGSGDPTAADVLILLEVFLHTSLVSDSLIKLFPDEEQNFRFWGYCLYVPDFQDL